jgi:hypothetical protein
VGLSFVKVIPAYLVVNVKPSRTTRDNFIGLAVFYQYFLLSGLLAGAISTFVSLRNFACVSSKLA